MTLKRNQPSVLPRPSFHPAASARRNDLRQTRKLSKGAEGVQQSGCGLSHCRRVERNSPICQQRALQNAADVLGEATAPSRH